MSNEIKMSEAFSLPVRCIYDEGGVPFQIDDSCGDLLIDGESTCDDTDYELVAHAINNHDRLVEENKQLREALQTAFDLLLISGWDDDYKNDINEITNLLEK